jgi:hypothetical protein
MSNGVDALVLFYSSYRVSNCRIYCNNINCFGYVGSSKEAELNGSNSNLTAGFCLILDFWRGKIILLVLKHY